MFLDDVTFDCCLDARLSCMNCGEICEGLSLHESHSLSHRARLPPPQTHEDRKDDNERTVMSGSELPQESLRLVNAFV